VATVNITSDNIETTVNEGGIVLLDFWASWCGPCRAFGPVFEAASEKYPEVVFGKIDTEAQQALAAQLQIRSIPTIMAFRDGIQLYSQPGALPADAFNDLIDKVAALDMDDVRAKIDDA
jgi:thioredoxin 1